MGLTGTRSYLTEKGFNRDVIEKGLSHEAGGNSGCVHRCRVRRAVQEDVQWWSDYVDGIVNEPKVIVGNFGSGAA